MTVYVESNFVLSVALGQEDSEPARIILEHAERGEVDIAFPVSALIEPYSTITHRGRERRRLRGALNDQLRELGRSQPHEEVVSTLRPLSLALAGIEEREIDLLDSTVRRMLEAGRPIDLDSEIFEQALIVRSTFDLAPLDATIYASVISDLTRASLERGACFVSKNWKDFKSPDLLRGLAQFRCEYAESFASALTIIAGW